MRPLAVWLLLLGHAATPMGQQAVPPQTAVDRITVVRGLVVADETGQPLRSARIDVASGGYRGGAVFSDQDGRFEIRVPEGVAHTVRITKSGYVARDLPLSSVVRPDVHQVRLVKGAVLAGRVLDRFGYPLPDAAVRLRRVAGPEDRPDSPGALTTHTDDLGEFRIGSLAAGQYEVQLDGPIEQYVLQTQESLRGLAASGAAGEGTAARLSVMIGSSHASTAADARGRVPAAVVQLQRGEHVVLDLAHEGGAASRGMVFHSGPGMITPGRPIFSAAESARAAGQLSGRIRGASGRPVEGAVVRLVSESGTFSPVALSNAEGYYEFPGVAGGTYRVVASAAGLMPAEYGQERGMPMGRPVTVRERQRVEHIDIALPPGAVISGTVTDAAGEPVEGLTVEVWQVQFQNGRNVLRPAAGVRARRTDDRGHYRLHGVPTGRHYVVASDHGTQAAGPSIAAPGTRVVVMTSAAAGPIQSAPRSYYPDRPSIQDALPVQVDVGIDAFGTDLVFAPAPTARVTGVALDQAGQPFRGNVTLAVSHRSGAPVPPPQRAAVDAEGRFEFADVAPGDYVVQANGAVMAASFRRLLDGVMAPMEATRTDAEFGMQFVTVNGADVGPILLRTSTGSTVTGRVVLEGDRAPAAFSGFRLGFALADPDRGPQATPPATIAADGTFELRGLSGPARFVAQSLPEGWWLKSVMIDGSNAADQPVTFGRANQSRHNVEVVFSSEGAEIAGQVVDARDQPAAGHSVIVFPVDWTRWHDRSRYLRLARTASNARFTVSSLPPGEYYAAAVDTGNVDIATSGEWQDPDVLRSLTSLAERVTVREGQRVETEIRVTRLPW